MMQFNWIFEEFKKSLITGYNSKILWGSRSIYRKDWIFIKKFINQYGIKKVIEYGSGLSTELLYLEGCEIYCLEDFKWWADHNRKVFKGIKQIRIEDYKIGEIPEVQERFDLAFVDGPQHERTETINHAMQYSDKFIYCHDRRQQDILDGNKDWNRFDFNELYRGHFFIKDVL